MKRKKYIPTRRAKTLRRALILLVLLLFLSTSYHFLPIQALRQYEEQALTGRTRVVYSLRETDGQSFPGLWRFLFSENENAVIFCAAQFYLLEGWVPVGVCAVDCAQDDAPVHAGVSHIRWGNQEIEAIFGRIEDPRVNGVQFNPDADDPLRNWGAVYRTLGAVHGEIDAPRLFFWIADAPLNYDEYGNPQIVAPLLRCYDAEQNVIWTQRLDLYSAVTVNYPDP